MKKAPRRLNVKLDTKLKNYIKKIVSENSENYNDPIIAFVKVRFGHEEKERVMVWVYEKERLFNTVLPEYSQEFFEIFDIDGIFGVVFQPDLRDELNSKKLSLLDDQRGEVQISII